MGEDKATASTPGVPEQSPPRRIRAVLFDFDGTLTRPGSIDFPAIKKALGCPGHQAILEFIDHLNSGPERENALRILDRYEMEAAEASRPNPNAEGLVSFLHSKSILLGIISRNSRRSIERALRNFPSVTPADFKVIISRDDARPKPHAEGVHLAAERLGVDPSEMLTVGDFVFDIEAAQVAGSPSVFLTNGSSPPDFARPPDYTIADLGEVRTLVDSLIPLSAGKLPNRFLKRFLEESPLDDPSVLVPPAVGEDVTVVDVQGNELIVLKTDPITFTADLLGFSTVVINANDVATAGASPRWLLTTLLFPVGSTAAQIHALMQELQQVSRQFGMSLCGGHTEITDAVDRPVAIGQLVGTTSRNRWIDKRQVAAGDQILLTKGIAVEGTSVLARDFPRELARLGMSPSEIETAQRFLFEPGISVREEAEVAARSGGVSALHDVTEGGVAMALEELSAASAHRIAVTVDRIPILPETERLCDLLALDPLGLLGSGALLVSCRPGRAENLVRDLREVGVSVSRIGEVLEEGTGIQARRGGRDRNVGWPRFEVDEIVRAIQKLRAVEGA